MVFVTEKSVSDALNHVMEISNCSVVDAVKHQDALVLGVLVDQFFGSQASCANQIIEDMRNDDEEQTDEHVVNQVSRHLSGRAKPRKAWVMRYCDAMNINASDFMRYKSDVLEIAYGIVKSEFPEVVRSESVVKSSERGPRIGRDGVDELDEIGRQATRTEQNQEKKSLVLREVDSRIAITDVNGAFQDIHVNIDDVGGNEALGMLANALVDVAAVSAENRTRLAQINRKFRTSKAMLENFLGIESFSVQGVLYDYSNATRKNKNDIDRLISAGIDVSAIRTYGESAIDAAAEAILQSQCLETLTLKVSGELHRRRLFIERLISNTGKNGLLEWIEIHEVDDDLAHSFETDRRLQLKSELIGGIAPKFQTAGREAEISSVIDFLTRLVESITGEDSETSTKAWIETSINELNSIPGHVENSKPTLEQSDYEAYAEMYSFWATKKFELLYKMVARYCRQEGQVSRILADVIEFSSREASDLNLNDRLRIKSVLRRVQQTRSGVIDPRSGAAFFEEVYENLPEELLEERSLCLYQMSYYRFRINEPEIALDLVLRAIELNRSNVAAVCFRAVLEMQEGRSEIASNLLGEAEKIDNSYIFIPFYKGVLHEAEGEYEVATIEYIRCLILAPNFYEAALNLTNCLLDLGRILDAARWVTAFLSKYSAPTLEFQTNIAVSLFQAGYSGHALKMLSLVYAETQAPLVALNIAKIYFGRAQSGPCKDWSSKVLSSDSSTKYERDEARQIADLVGKDESIKMVLGAELTLVEREEEVGDALGLLLASDFQLASGTNNDLFQTVRRAVQSKPKKAEKFAPKSVLALQNAEVRKSHNRKIAEQKRRYSEQIKTGHLDAEPKPQGRKRRKADSKKLAFTGGIMLTRAPSYSAG